MILDQIKTYNVGSITVYKVNYDFTRLNLFNQWYKFKYSFNEHVVPLSQIGPRVESTPNLKDSNFPIWKHYRENLYNTVTQLFNSEFILDRMWYNEYPTKSHINLHSHPKDHIVSVGYIDVDVNDKSSSLVIQNKDDMSFVDIPVINGDVLIFNGNVMHKTNPNMSNKTRKVVGLNYQKIFENTLV